MSIGIYYDPQGWMSDALFSMTCNTCDSFIYHHAFDDLLILAELQGWKSARIDKKWTHHCPDCGKDKIATKLIPPIYLQSMLDILAMQDAVASIELDKDDEGRPMTQSFPPKKESS